MFNVSRKKTLACSVAVAALLAPLAAVPGSHVPGEGAHVVLTTKVGSIDIAGELISFDGTEYVVLSPTGEYRMRADRVTCAGEACPASALAEKTEVATNPQRRTDLAAAPLVTLTTRVGAIEISGRLLEFTGKEYVLFTPTGEYRMQSAAVTCFGAGCPAEATDDAPVVAAATEAAPAVETMTAVAPVARAKADVTAPAADDADVTAVAAADTAVKPAAVAEPESSAVATAETDTEVTETEATTLAAADTATTDAGVAEAEAPEAETAETEANTLAAAEPVETPTEVAATDAPSDADDAATATADAATAPIITAEINATAATVAAAATAAAAAPDAAPDPITFDPAAADMRITSADAVGLGLLPSLWRGYADSRGLEYELVMLSDSETVGRFMNDAGEPQATHFAAGTDPSRPFEALIDRTAEFGMASRPPDAREVAALRNAGAGDLMDPENNTVIAVESIAMIVHPENPVSALSLDQIAAIYRGDITNWAQLGGQDTPIQVLSRNDGASSREVLSNMVGDGNLVEAAGTIYTEGGNNGMRQAVLSSTSAIGYVPFGAADGVKRLNLAGRCGIVSAALPFAVKAEEYPLVRRHYLFSRSDTLTAEAKNFVDYARSPAAEAAISASNLVNFALEVEPKDMAMSRYETIQNGSYTRSEERVATDLAEDLLSWQRLSTTLRFATGSSQLGKKEMADLERLIAYLGLQEKGTEVAVVGFADSVGGFNGNLRLSGDRAALVANAIKATDGASLDGIEFTTKGYGELAPVACNDTEAGRSINRRVEIWIRHPS